MLTTESASLPRATRIRAVSILLAALSGAGSVLAQRQPPVSMTAPEASAPVAPRVAPRPPEPAAPGVVPLVVVPLAPAQQPHVKLEPLGYALNRADDNAGIFGLTKLHKLRVTMSLAEWTVLQTSRVNGAGGVGGQDYTLSDGRLIHVGSGFGGYFPWVHVDLKVGELELKDVGLRYKGNYSFSASSASAPLRANFKLKTDLFGGKGDWGGVETFNFHAGVLDQTRMREAISYAVFRAAGVPAPRTAYVEINFTVPGLYQDTPGGMYTLIENVNKQFLKRVLPPGTGLLLKPEGLTGGVQAAGLTTWESYIPRYRPERDATPHEQQRVMEFANLISQTDVALFRSRIGNYLDVESFLRFVAVHSLLQNSDSYLGGRHNFYLYLDPKDDKFRFIPWDQDLSMGSRGGGGGAGADPLMPINGNQPLIFWLLEDPVVAARYKEIVKEITATVFNRTELLRMVDELEKVGTGRVGSPRDFIEGRISSLQRMGLGK